MTRVIGHRTVALLLVALAHGCGPSVPGTAEGIVDALEDAGIANCRERREPVPDVVTCEDDGAGDLTVGITDTALDTVRRTAATTAGPWVAGDTFVVLTYDEDLDRADAIVEVLGQGVVYVLDDEGSPVTADR